MTNSDAILFSGGAPGAEAAFGAAAERHGIDEVNFTFEGHKIERRRGVRVLNQEQNGWFTWSGEAWQPRGSDGPIVTHVHVTGTGTRRLGDNGRRAIDELFARSFGR